MSDGAISRVKASLMACSTVLTRAKTCGQDPSVYFVRKEKDQSPHWLPAAPPTCIRPQLLQVSAHQPAHAHQASNSMVLPGQGGD